MATTTASTLPEPRDPITPMPANKRRKSRHAVPALVSEPEPVSSRSIRGEGEEEEETMREETTEMTQYEKNALYGKRYQMMMDVLELAIKSSSEKWT